MECIRKEAVGCVISQPLYLAVESGKVHSKTWSAVGSIIATEEGHPKWAAGVP